MLFATLTEIVDPEPHAAALNMAIDEVLLREARAPLLRVYRWAQPAVSFGYFGKFAEVEHAWPRREAVRRWTGGGIVPHGGDLTYTIVIPVDDPFARLAARESYRRIHECIAVFLREMGCVADMAPSAQARVSNACFENAVEFDVLSANAKIAGAAQRRTQWGLLHQGSIQLTGLGATFAGGLAALTARKTLRAGITPAHLASAQELAGQKYAAKSWHERF